MLLERATLAVGRLDSISTLLPDPHLFLYSYVRREAVLSSQIEGTQSSLSDLLLFELAEAPGTALDDVVEVSNYIAALEHGVARIRDGFPLSNRLLREMHAVLMTKDWACSPPAFNRDAVRASPFLNLWEFVATSQTRPTPQSASTRVRRHGRIRSRY